MRGKRFLKKPNNRLSIFPLDEDHFGHSANLFDKIVKTAFYVSRKIFCRKKLIHQFQILGDMFKDFWQETETTLSSFQNCSLRVEKEFDINSLAFFSLSHQGLQTGHWLFGVNFRGKIHFKKTIFFYCFRTLTELFLRVQRNVLFRNTVLEFFSSVHDFEPKVFLDLAEFLWLFFRNRLLRHHKNF